MLAAVTGLLNISALKHLWHFNRGEFAVAMVAWLGVLGSGLLRGVLIGAVLSVRCFISMWKTRATASSNCYPTARTT